MVDVISRAGCGSAFGMGELRAEFELFGLTEDAGLALRGGHRASSSAHGRARTIDREGKRSERQGADLAPPGAASLARRDVRARRPPRRALGCRGRPTRSNFVVMKYWTGVYRAAGEEYGTSDKLGCACCATAGSPTRSRTSNASGGRRSAAITGSTSTWFALVAEREPSWPAVEAKRTSSSSATGPTACSSD